MVEGSDSAPDGYIRNSTRMQHKDSKIKKMWKRKKETFEDLGQYFIISRKYPSSILIWRRNKRY